MEQLISKYLQNDLSKEEAAELKEWLERDSLNRKVFENLVSDWKLSDGQIKDSQNRVLERVMAHDPVTPAQHRPSYWRYALKIAAMLLLSLGLGYFMLEVSDQFTTGQVAVHNVLVEKEAQYGQKLICELPDGSVVHLNSGSKITYPKTFSGSNRPVTLTGEAFFDVARDEQKPFEITSGEVNVRVLGTSFNVKSYNNSSEIEVAVKTGKVSVSNTRNDERVLLLPEELVTYQNSDASMKKVPITNSAMIFGWREQNLIFEEVKIDEIIKTLERWYDVKFDVKTKLDKKKTFTGEYKNPSLKAVMESLSYAYEFEYELKDRIITIK